MVRFVCNSFANCAFRYPVIKQRIDVYFNIRLLKIEEKNLRMANRDANRMTNIKKGYLGKERTAKNSYGYFLNFSLFVLDTCRRFNLSFKIIVVVTKKISRLKANVCIKLNIFHECLAKLLSQNVIFHTLPYFS